jgi:hypothetical protein
MNFHPNERTALFIDGANLYAAARALGFDIDYKRLLTLFNMPGVTSSARYTTRLWPMIRNIVQSVRSSIGWIITATRW